MKWEENILGFVPQKDWLAIPFNPTRPNDPADQLIGDLKTPNLVAEWQSIAAQYQLPAMAMFHSFDTEAQKAVRVPIDTHNIEKGLIKEKINQSERMRALLRAGVQGDDQLYDYVLRDGFNLAENVLTRTKVAKNELLATGKITIKENNLDLTVDYGVASGQTTLTLDLGASADAAEGIEAIVAAARAAGVTLTGMYTSSAVLTKMRKNLALQKIINGNTGAGALIRRSALVDFLGEEFGLTTVLTNDLTYAYDRKLASNGTVTQSTTRYFPANKVTFFAQTAGGKIGTGLWGDSPELDVSALQKVSGSEVSPYIAISQWTENDPAVLWTKASALFMPVLYNPSSLWIATEIESAAAAG